MASPVRFILLAIVLWTSGAWAASEEPRSVQETELIEATLEPAQVEADDKKLRITLPNGKTFEFANEPDVDKMRESLGLNLSEKMKAQVLAAGGSIDPVNPLAAYETLSDEKRAQFQASRVAILKGTARFLTWTKFAYGAGTFVGDAVSFVKVKTLKAIGKEVEVAPKEKRTFQMRSEQAVENILRGLDYKLFSQAPLVVDKNEVGLVLSMGILAESGVAKKGFGGSEEIGLSMAYSKSKKAFIFEIFHSSEKFESTLSGVGVVGIVGKAGIQVAHRHGAESLKGTSFYPPGIPGFSTISPEYAAIGVSSSYGLPPLADYMTYSNKFERTNMIRITISPLVPGFVRVQFGSFVRPFQLMGMRFVDGFQLIAQKIKSKKAPSCAALFLATSS